MASESSLDAKDGDVSLKSGTDALRTIALSNDRGARPNEFNSCFSLPEETAVGDSSPSDSASWEQVGGDAVDFFVAVGELDDVRREANSELSRS